MMTWGIYLIQGLMMEFVNSVVKLSFVNFSLVMASLNI